MVFFGNKRLDYQKKREGLISFVRDSEALGAFLYFHILACSDRRRLRPKGGENILYCINSILCILKQYRLPRSLNVTFLKVFRYRAFFFFFSIVKMSESHLPLYNWPMLVSLLSHCVILLHDFALDWNPLAVRLVEAIVLWGTISVGLSYKTEGESKCEDRDWAEDILLVYGLFTFVFPIPTKIFTLKVAVFY